MYSLKNCSLLMVGDREDKSIFEEFFYDITLGKNNDELLILYKIQRPSIVFLYYNGNDKDNKIIRKIKRIDKKVIIVLILKDINVSLLDVLSLNLFGCLIKPFQKEKIEVLLTSMNNEIKLSFSEIKKLKNNYFFNMNTEKLYNELKKEIKLTKNERYFLSIILSSKGSYVSIETIEYLIWEEASLEKNCAGRLKSLLNGIRKKLPKHSIVNQYSIGYMLQY